MDFLSLLFGVCVGFVGGAVTMLFWGKPAKRFADQIVKVQELYEKLEALVKRLLEKLEEQK